MTVEEIYEAHAEFVWRTLRRLGVPESDVADAVQDVFLAVHRSLPRFEGRSAVTTWLFAICRGVARDRRRRAHVRYEVGDDVAIARERDLAPDAIARLDVSDRARLLAAALDAMDDDQREVFVLFELEGLGGEAIAEMVGAKTSTVYTRLRLARDSFERFVARHRARERGGTR